MMPTLAPPSVLSAPQRRCQILLTLFQPGLTATTATFSELNGVDDDIASLDISETGREILRYHQLTLTTGYDGSYRVEGTVLNQRLCLFHWLRRGFRLCPSFITSHFTPALKSELKRRGIARNFYDDTNLQALVNLCSRRLQKHFETRDIHFLCLYLQYCLLQHHAGITPQFNPLQRRWAESCLEFQVAQEIDATGSVERSSLYRLMSHCSWHYFFHVAGSRSTAGCASAGQTTASVYQTSGKPFS